MWGCDDAAGNLPGIRGLTADRKESPYFGSICGKVVLFILEFAVVLDVLLFKGLLFARDRLDAGPALLWWGAHLSRRELGPPRPPRPTLRFMMRHFLEVMWLEYDPECENRLPQLAHSKGFSPLWIRICSCEEWKKLWECVAQTGNSVIPCKVQIKGKKMSILVSVSCG